MVLFLTSSPTGALDGSIQVDGLDDRNDFVINLRKYWKADSRVLMISADPGVYEQNDEMTGFFAGVMKYRDFTWSAFDIWDYRSGQFSEDIINSYDVIFLAGGHVPTQNKYFKELELGEKIKAFEGIIIGISAGSMNCAATVYAQPEEAGESINPDYERFISGLGLTDVNILPHYQMIKNYWLDGKRLFEDITYGDSFGKKFLVLPDGSYLMSVNGQESVWGEAYIIEDGILKNY